MTYSKSYRSMRDRPYLTEDVPLIISSITFNSISYHKVPLPNVIAHLESTAAYFYKKNGFRATIPPSARRRMRHLMAL